MIDDHISEKINELIDSRKFNKPIHITQEIDNEFLKQSLKTMITIRLVEQKLAKEKKNKKIGGPVHLGVGQEAIATAVAHNLRKSDRIFGAHRSHSHLLSLGADIRNLFSEILGKKTGLSKGMGGSMHLWDKPNGFYGSVPIVSGTVPLALGAGLAAKMDEKNDIALAYLGDSALEEGVVHECFNIASLMNIPIIFVIENNLFGSHMHISQRQSQVSSTRFAKANNIDYSLVDGNNIVDLFLASKRLIDQARKHNKPGFIEAITYRWYGHVDWREDVDVGIHRSSKDLSNWKKRDPIKRLLGAMIEKNLITKKYYETFLLETERVIDISWEKSTNDPFPDQKNLFDYVFKS